MLDTGSWVGTVTVTMAQAVARTDEGLTATLTMRRSIAYDVLLEGRMAIGSMPGRAGTGSAAWAATPARSRMAVSVSDRRVERSEGGNTFTRALVTETAQPLRPMRFVTLGIDAASSRYKLHLDGDTFDETEVTEDTNEGTRRRVITNGRSTPTFELEDLPWPSSGVLLSGTRSFELENEVEAWRDLAPKVTYTVSWNLLPGSAIDCEYLRREIERARKRLDGLKPGAEAKQRLLLVSDPRALAELASAAAQGTIPPGADALTAVAIQQEMGALPGVGGADGEAYFRSLSGYAAANPMPIPLPPGAAMLPEVQQGQQLRSSLAALALDGGIGVALLDELRRQLKRCTAAK